MWAEEHVSVIATAISEEQSRTQTNHPNPQQPRWARTQRAEQVTALPPEHSPDAAVETELCHLFTNANEGAQPQPHSV